MKRIGLLSFALAATLTVACSSNKAKDADRAKGGKPDTVGTSGAADLVSRDASDFIRYIATVNTAEIELGKLAADRGSSDEVKKFAKMMIADHTSAGDKLKALGSDLKVEAPTQLDDKHMEQRDKLARLRGADFDREYVTTMADSHKDLIDQLEPRIDKKTLGRVEGRDERQDVGDGRDRRHSSGPQRRSSHDADQSVRGGHLPDGARAPGSRQGARAVAEEALHDALAKSHPFPMDDGSCSAEEPVRQPCAARAGGVSFRPGLSGVLQHPYSYGELKALGDTFRPYGNSGEQLDAACRLTLQEPP